VTISSRFILRPRLHHRCEACLRVMPITEAHWILFGLAEPCDPPFSIRICRSCIRPADLREGPVHGPAEVRS
jgi:hypothetical protein